MLHVLDPYRQRSRLLLNEKLLPQQAFQPNREAGFFKYCSDWKHKPRRLLPR